MRQHGKEAGVFPKTNAVRTRRLEQVDPVPVQRRPDETEIQSQWLDRSRGSLRLVSCSPLGFSHSLQTVYRHGLLLRGQIPRIAKIVVCRRIARSMKKFRCLI